MVTHLCGLHYWFPPFPTVLLSVVNLFSKLAHFVPLPKFPSAKEIAQLILKHVFHIHGILVNLVSDQGPQFASERSFATGKRLRLASPQVSTSNSQSV